jgi:hypothetical protein
VRHVAFTNYLTDKYALTTGQHFGAALDFAPIPKVVISAANKAVNGL